MKYLMLVFAAFILMLAQMPNALGTQSDGYIHKNHFYAVSYDGEGDAIVRAQIEIENTLQDPIHKVSFEIPNEVVVYKIMQQNDYIYPYYQYGEMYTQGYPRENNNPKQLSYTKAINSSSTVIEITLDRAIYNAETSTITLFYKMPNNAQKDVLGNFSYDFSSIMDGKAILIENMRVAVNVAPELYLKGTEQHIEYRAAGNFLAEADMQKVAGMSNSMPITPEYYDNIRYTSGKVEISQNLDAFESFHVKGNYGKEWILLNLVETALGLIGLVVIIAIGGVVARTGLRQLSAEKNSNDWALVTLSAAASTAAIFISMIGAVIASESLRFSYSLSWLVVLIFLGAAALSLGALLLPPLYIASRKGAIKGLVAFVLTVIFTIIVFAAVVMFFSISSGTSVIY